jgi:valyl-tRNA synthetase
MGEKGMMIPEDLLVSPSQGDWSLADSWIWARVQSLINEVERLFQNYQYGEAGRQIYDFLWGDYADWYLEVAKLQIRAGGRRSACTVMALARVLDLCLRLLHPFTPFVTEELWGHLRRALLASPLASLAQNWPEALIVARWPEPRPEEGWERQVIVDFSLVQDVVRAIRNLRAEKNVPPGKRFPAILVAGENSTLFKDQGGIITALAGLDASGLTIIAHLAEKPAGHVALVVGVIEVYLPLAGLVDLAEERARLEKALSEAESQIERLTKLLTGPFAQNAPAHVVQAERDKLAGYHESAAKLKSQLASE